MHQTLENFIRVFELPQFTWFDVKYKSNSGRVFDTLNMKAEVTGNYLTFKNFNPIYNRYHTCVMMRVLDFDNEVEKKIDPLKNTIFSNPFRQSFKLINIIEESMNDEHFDIQILPGFTQNLPQPAPSTERLKNDRVILFSVRRTAMDKIVTKIEGFDVSLIKQGATSFFITSSKCIDDKRLTLRFILNQDEIYLLDFVKIISAPYQKDGQINAVVHLANAHDFLLRFKFEDLGGPKTEDIGMAKVKVLTISNPFFGLEGNDVPDPDPLFLDDQYITLTNYEDTEAYIKAYTIDKKTMDTAVTRTGPNANLFSFKLEVADKLLQDQQRILTQKSDTSFGTYSTPYRHLSQTLVSVRLAQNQKEG